MSFVGGLMLALALLSYSTGFAASADSAPPDREMLKMMDLLQEMEMIRQMDMLQDMQNLQQDNLPAKSNSTQKPTPAKRKETAK